MLDTQKTRQRIALLVATFAVAPVARGADAEGSARYHDAYETEAEVPEPLVFDLVRRLGSRGGELEVNTLVRFERTGGATVVVHAPEVEYTIGDGVGVELELPMVGSTVLALKAAVQFTLARTGARGSIIHGVQAFHEHGVARAAGQFASTYVLGHRVSQAHSYLLMLGAALDTQGSDRAGAVALANATWFYDANRVLDLGLEVNVEGFSPRPRLLRVLPQVHVLFASDWKLQVGVGVTSRDGDLEPAAALRFVKEFN